MPQEISYYQLLTMLRFPFCLCHLLISFLEMLLFASFTLNWLSESAFATCDHALLVGDIREVRVDLNILEKDATTA
jgi:hypothetical protein